MQLPHRRRPRDPQRQFRIHNERALDSTTRISFGARKILDRSRALASAGSVTEVQEILRETLSALYRRPIDIDLAGADGHLLGAKEIGSTLIRLSAAYPEAALKAVLFREFPAYAYGARAQAVADAAGVSIVFNTAYYGAGTRADLALALLHARRNGIHHYSVDLMGAVDTVHEFGHVLDYTVDRRQGYRHEAGENPLQFWTTKDAIAGLAGSLADDLAATGGVPTRIAMVARARDRRNPLGTYGAAVPLLHEVLDFHHDDRQWGLDYWRIKDSVSRHALKNSWELVAESFTRVVVDQGSADPVSAAVHRRLTSALGMPGRPPSCEIRSSVAALHREHTPDQILGTDLNPEFAKYLRDNRDLARHHAYVPQERDSVPSPAAPLTAHTA